MQIQICVRTTRKLTTKKSTCHCRELPSSTFSDRASKYLFGNVNIGPDSVKGRSWMNPITALSPGPPGRLLAPMLCKRSMQPPSGTARKAPMDPFNSQVKCLLKSPLCFQSHVCTDSAVRCRPALGHSVFYIQPHFLLALHLRKPALQAQ